MLSRQQQLLALGGAIGAVIVIGVLASALTQKPSTVSVDNTGEVVSALPGAEGEVVPVAEEPEKAPTPAPAKKPVAPAPVAQTYDQIVESYKASGYRFQFSDCSGSPGSITIKKGLKFMMDNRDAASHSFAVGSQKFTLGKYGYKIVTATELGSLNITCDGRGSATLNVQP